MTRRWIEWRVEGIPIRASPSLFRGKNSEEEKRRLSRCFRVAFLEVSREGKQKTIPKVAGIEFTPLSKLHGITNRLDNWVGIDPRRTSPGRLSQADLKMVDGLGIQRSKIADYFVTYFIVHELLHVKYPELGEREVKRKTRDLVRTDSFVNRLKGRRPIKKSA